jgi:hypothetical protein
MHYPTAHTQSLAFHLSADLLNIRKEDVDTNVDEIEIDNPISYLVEAANFRKRDT